MRIDLALGINGSTDLINVKMWNPGLNPSTNVPSYRVNNASLVQGSQVKIK